MDEAVTSGPSLRAEIEQLERRVWDALVTGDADADRELLAADFVGLYPTGFADRQDHVGQLQAGPTVADYRLTEQRIVVVGPEAALLCYRADYRRVGSDPADDRAGSDPADDRAGGTETMYVSSLWCRRNGSWLNVFSQDTPPGRAVV